MISELVIAILLFLLLVVSVYSDLSHHRVYDWVTIPGILLGIALNSVFYGGAGFWNSLLGFVVGFGVFFIAFIAGGIGGGDVKLMGAVGALAGYPFVLWAVLYTTLIGGLMGMIVLIWHGELGSGLKRSFRFLFTFRARERLISEGKGRTIPYGFAIVLGTYCAWFLKGL